MPGGRGRAKWELPQPCQSQANGAYGRPLDGRLNGSGMAGGGHDTADRSATADPISTDEIFGVMAPCWRLLERAKGYMEKVMSVGRVLTLPTHSSSGWFSPVFPLELDSIEISHCASGINGPCACCCFYTSSSS